MGAIHLKGLDAGLSKRMRTWEPGKTEKGAWIGGGVIGHQMD